MSQIEVTPEQEREVERILLRSVYELTRQVLRHNGVNKARVTLAMGQLEVAVERVKEFDGGTMDEQDKLDILNGYVERAPLTGIEVIEGEGGLPQLVAQR